jgi:CO/xanthine dehydrogenase Mo-binding subunit
MPGVIAVVRDGSFLGVVAEREEQAIKAREALRQSAKWTLGPELPDPARIFEVIKSLPSKDATIGVKQGAVPADARTFEAGLHQALHVARLDRSILLGRRVQGWRMTVWTHSQGVFPLRAELVKVLKMPAAAIRCVHVEGSGCYGHNGADDVAGRRGAAGAGGARPPGPSAMDARRRIRLGAVWSAMVMHAKAALGGDGKIATGNTKCGATAIPHGRSPADGTNVLAGWYLAEPQKMGPADEPAATGRRRRSQRHSALRFPEPAGRSITSCRTCRSGSRRCARSAPMPTCLRSSPSWMRSRPRPAPIRSLSASHNLKDPRARAVIEAVAKKAGWKAGEKGDGTRGRGIGFAKYKNLACYVAVVAEVVVDRATGWSVCRRPGPQLIPA